MITLERDACLDFLSGVEHAVGPLGRLAQLADGAVLEAVEGHLDVLRTAVPTTFGSALGDPACGICAVDVPDGLRDHPALDAVCGGVLATAVNMLIMKPVFDQKNGTPFTLHTASRRNEDLLRDAGLKFFSPGEKLGFHTDGLLGGGSVSIPRYVSVYNIQIAYRRPGNFYWIPFELWAERGVFAAALGVGTEFEFELTPIVYDVSDDLEVNRPSIVRAPIFHQSSDGRLMVFLNGEVVGVKGGDGWSALEGVVERMRTSLLDNPSRIAIPIRSRRLFVMNNQAGFHARDIFEEPIGGVKYTRSYLRAVSSESVRVSSTDPGARP